MQCMNKSVLIFIIIYNNLLQYNNDKYTQAQITEQRGLIFNIFSVAFFHRNQGSILKKSQKGATY